jgi:predicted nucleic acid-binding protein
MKKVIVDLNVILDFLNKRNDHEVAASIFELCVNKKISGFVCAHEITTLAYFLTKETKSRKKVYSAIYSLLDIFTVIPTTEIILKNALESDISDFEDAVIEASGVFKDIDFIITRDKNDFKKSKIPSIPPKDFLQKL